MGDVNCVVFQTDVRAGDNWMSWAALEVASPQAKPLETGSEHHIFFRSPKGHIQDITSSVEITSRAGQLSISSSYGAINSIIDIGFDITFSGSSDSGDASFDGFVDRNIQGSRTRQDWRGTFVCVKKQPIAVVQQGPAELPQRVHDFLNIDPWTILGNGEHVDSVAQLASTLLRDLIMAAMPPPAIGLFYGGQVDDPHTKVSDLISKIENYRDNIQGYLDPRTMQRDFEDFLQITAIHVMVRDVRSGDWLNDLQKGRAADKVEQLFNIFKCNENDRASLGVMPNLPALPVALALYNDTNGVHPDRYRGFYRSALRRCYLSSYIQLRPAWDGIVRAPAGSWTDMVTYLKSDNFMIHFLPTLIDTVENKYAVPLKERMNILGDKLSFLATMTGFDTGNTPPSSEIEDIIKKLVTAANQSGLIRGTMVEEFSADNMNERIINSPYAALPGIYQFMMSAFDTRASDILENYATPLGLYAPLVPGFHGIGDLFGR